MLEGFAGHSSTFISASWCVSELVATTIDNRNAPYYQHVFPDDIKKVNVMCAHFKVFDNFVAS